MNTITTSLAVSKKLKEAGWEQEAVFYWWPRNKQWLCTAFPKRYSLQANEIFAPTAEEVLRELPVRLEREVSRAITNSYDLIVSPLWKHGGKYMIEYSDQWNKSKKGNVTRVRNLYTEDSVFEADTIANAAAEMWIYLKTNNLL